jgi:hypothetical protein
MPEMRLSVPGGFVPQVGVMFGATGGDGQAVDAAHPLPVGLGTATVAVAGAAPGAPIGTAIAAGETLSPAIDLGDQRLCAIALPAGWTTAALSFQVSATGDAFVDLFDVAGEVTVPAAVAAGGRAIVVSPALFHGLRYLRLRSGVAGAGVVQAAARTIVLTTVAR